MRPQENREIRRIIAEEDHPENPIRVEVDGAGYDVLWAEVDPAVGETVLHIADRPYWRKTSFDIR